MDVANIENLRRKIIYYKGFFPLTWKSLFLATRKFCDELDKMKKAYQEGATDFHHFGIVVHYYLLPYVNIIYCNCAMEYFRWLT